MRVCLVHWNASEAESTRHLLANAEYQVEYQPEYSTAVMRQWRQSPPDAFVIDLSRLPSHGREIAVSLRQSPKTCHVPIVFCEGEAAKVRLVQAVLPDAVYCSSVLLLETLNSIQPVANPATPPAMMNRYGSRTAAQKLGIKQRSTVAMIDPPRTVYSALGELPDGVQFVEEHANVTLAFVHSVDDLRARLSYLRSLTFETKRWILWRKQTASGHTGVKDGLVRETGIALGLVDYKICSVDDNWTAMLFALKK